MPPGALESVMQHGLLSAEEVVKRPGLLQLARPDKADQKLLLQLLKMRSKDEDSALMMKGPSVFFSPPPKEKITEDHYMRKWGLVPLRVDLDRLWRDDPSLRVHGTELTPWKSLGNTPAARRKRDLTPEEVDAFRRTPPRDLWQHYNDTRYYAADVPHAALITRDGRIDPKYLRVIGKQKLEKTAVGFARLASIVGKDRHPLFHMTSLENMKGIEASGRLMSSGEAAARGLVKDVEGGGSFGRTALPSTAPRYRMNISGDSASVPVEDLAYRRLDKPGALANASMPGTVGEYGLASLRSSHHNPSKNWDTISLSPEPDLAYGPVGVLTGSHKVKGVLRSNHPYAEVQASGTPRFDKDGLIEAVDMPSATGTVVYDPQTTPRDVARALKAKGAVPINARLRRRLAAVSRGAGQTPATDAESGNISGEAMLKMPEYHRLTALAKARLSLEKTADKNNPGRITKMLKAPKPDLKGFAPLAYVKGTAKKSYLVGIQDGSSWRCTCPNWTYRGSKSGEPCKHIRAVQEQKGKRGKKGHAKTAATRYDKEVARGNISYTAIASRMPAEHGFSPGEIVDRFDVHHAMAEPSKAPNLKRLRRIRDLSVRPTAKDVTQRYGFDVRLPRKRKGQGGAWMSESMGPNPVIRVPVGGIDTRATLDHEIAEALERKHQGGTRRLASHNGPGPLVAERHGLVGDPAAFEEYKEMRAGHRANPDDRLIWKKMKQMGATPDRPMPVGGKAHRSLNRWLDRNADMLSSDARERTMDEAESHARRFVRDGTPLPAASYVPANLRATLLDHAKDPDSRDFIFPWHPRHGEREPLNNWVEAPPRAAPKVDIRASSFSPAEVAAALTNRSKATGSQLRTLLRAVRAGAL